MPSHARRPSSSSSESSSTAQPSAAPSIAESNEELLQLLQSEGGLPVLEPEPIQATPGLLAMLEQTPSEIQGSPPQARDDEYEVAEHEGSVAERGEGDRHAIDPNDVDQGMVGDCYLHASMAAIARVNPEALRELISDNGNGTYDVTLHFDVQGDWIPWAVDEVITVDDQFPTREDGMPAYAGDSGVRDGAELWVMLIEKAWAVAQGSYDAIWSGRNPQGMRLLGMEDVSNARTSSMTAEEIGTFLHEHLEAEHALVCQTPDYAESGEATRELAEEVGAVGGHGYAVMEVDAEAGTVDLYNPWGTDHLTGLSLEDFKQLYTWITVGQ